MQHNTIEKTTKAIIRESLLKSMSYVEYRNLVSQLAENGKSTGPEQNEALTGYTLLNDRRMKRWDKTIKFSDAEKNQISHVKRKLIWLVLTESWCGDASPSLPVMHKIAELNPNISLKIVLRDEHNDLMNRFLTNDTRSIPKLIAIDVANEQVVHEWGPRSKAATRLVEEFKVEQGPLTAAFKEDLQIWYNKDKGQSVLKDLTSLLLK